MVNQAMTALMNAEAARESHQRMLGQQVGGEVFHPIFFKEVSTGLVGEVMFVSMDFSSGFIWYDILIHLMSLHIHDTHRVLWQYVCMYIYIYRVPCK